MDFRSQNQISIPFGNVQLKGELIIPSKAKAVVIFSHGSGSSRFSPRNKMVADYLHHEGLGILLFDLLTVPTNIESRGPDLRKIRSFMQYNNYSFIRDL